MLASSPTERGSSPPTNTNDQRASYPTLHANRALLIYIPVYFKASPT